MLLRSLQMMAMEAGSLAGRRTAAGSLAPSGRFGAMDTILLAAVPLTMLDQAARVTEPGPKGQSR